jgi:hypothetical protein
MPIVGQFSMPIDTYEVDPVSVGKKYLSGSSECFSSFDVSQKPDPVEHPDLPSGHATGSDFYISTNVFGFLSQTRYNDFICQFHSSA